MGFLGFGKKPPKQKQDKSLLFILTFLIFCFAFQRRNDHSKNLENPSE